jgi:predicted Co/Zn/Cd cation transporter (cation efflux family)
LVGAVGDILRGGRDVDAGWAVAYGVLAALAGLGITLFLRRRSRTGFAGSFGRASKVGSRLDVEIDFVVDAGSTPQTVRELDAVRADLAKRLAALHPAPSMWIGFTADPRWTH